MQYHITQASVRLARKKSGLSLDAAASAAGVSLRTFCNWEYGVNNPSPAAFEFFCKNVGVDMNEVKGEFGVSRDVPNSRTRRRLFNGETAAAALRGAGWGAGREMFGFTKGQFSFVDLIEAALDMAGPCDAVIATWTAANADLSRIDNFLAANKIKTAQWVVDYSFETRQPRFCAQLRETFGDEAIRTVPSHCKFVLLSNENWKIVVQTSMNLNQNARLENFWIADDADLYAEYRAVVDELFKTQKAGEGFGDKPNVRRAEFGKLGEGKKSSFFNVKKGADLFG